LSGQRRMRLEQSHERFLFPCSLRRRPAICARLQRPVSSRPVRRQTERARRSDGAQITSISKWEATEMASGAQRIPPVPPEAWTPEMREVFALIEGPEARERGAR